MTDRITEDLADQQDVHVFARVPGAKHPAHEGSGGFQVLERLLLDGRLPVGRRRMQAVADDFTAIDIGAGPGPAIFAIRSFYAALVHYSCMQDPPGLIAALRHRARAKIQPTLTPALVSMSTQQGLSHSGQAVRLTSGPGLGRRAGGSDDRPAVRGSSAQHLGLLLSARLVGARWRRRARGPVPRFPRLRQHRDLDAGDRDDRLRLAASPPTPKLRRGAPQAAFVEVWH
jgi:hypothetical protein